MSEWPLSCSLELGALPTAVPVARLWTRNVLAEWQLHQLADDAEMIVSELMSNALTASLRLDERPPIALRLLADRERLVIEAWDQSPFDLEPSEAADDAEHGRGLLVVVALSSRWGSERVGYRRKVVWCELSSTAK